MTIDDASRAFAYRSIVATRDLMELDDQSESSILDTAAWRPREISLFPDSMRREAARMARLYEVFYCVEQAVRDLVRKGLHDDDGALNMDAIKPDMVGELKKRKRAESQSGITPREGDLLDFATLGELGQIIDSNWETSFREFIPQREAIKRLLANLNVLRSPVAHSIPLPRTEANRLAVLLADWFRLTT